MPREGPNCHPKSDVACLAGDIQKYGFRVGGMQKRSRNLTPKQTPKMIPKWTLKGDSQGCPKDAQGRPKGPPKGAPGGQNGAPATQQRPPKRHALYLIIGVLPIIHHRWLHVTSSHCTETRNSRPALGRNFIMMKT